MRIILNTFGSFGDIHPYMAIAMELQRRGHTPADLIEQVFSETPNSHEELAYASGR
jgi:rhamnosyltransferase subunit B